MKSQVIAEIKMKYSNYLFNEIISVTLCHKTALREDEEERGSCLAAACGERVAICDCWWVRISFFLVYIVEHRRLIRCGCCCDSHSPTEWEWHGRRDTVLPIHSIHHPLPPD